MSETPQEVHLSLAEFDREQLPLEQRAFEGDEFRDAVREHLAQQFATEGGAAEVIVTGDRIIIRWMDAKEGQTLTTIGIDYLKAGETEKGIATIKEALKRDPADHKAAFNLGMALTEQGQYQQSMELLERLLTEHPGHAQSWVALSVAQAKLNLYDACVRSLQQALSLDPKDGHAHKNLGALLASIGKLPDALVHMELAVTFLPGDVQAWLNYAKALEESGQSARADPAYQKVQNLDATGNAGKIAEEGRTRIAAQQFHQQGGTKRAIAVEYCLSALQKFEGMPKPEVQKIAFEIAMLGSRGLDLNNPSVQYQLESMPGKFSGLQLLCIQYVGFQIIQPSLDLGFDLSEEYQVALGLLGRCKD